MALFSKSDKKKNTSRRIVLRERSDFKKLIVLIDNPENIVHNVLHKQFPNAEFSFLTNRSEKVDISTGKNYTFNKKDFKFATLKNERLKDLLLQEFDLLIDLSQSNDNLRYFAEHIKADLKIGCFDTSKNYLYDILVEKKENIRKILEQIKIQLDLLTIQ